jgi:hypothetical protein
MGILEVNVGSDGKSLASFAVAGPFLEVLMKFYVPTLAAVISLAVAGCASTELQPIPGSITYNGQPRTKLMKSPIGSTFEHSFRDPRGDEYVETYQIRADRSLRLISRHRTNLFIGLGNGRD